MTPEDLTDLMARATRPRRTVPIVLNGELRQQIQDLDDELQQLDAKVAVEERDRRLGRRAAPADNSRRAQIEAEIAALYEQAAADTVHIVLQGLAGTPWRALMAEHPMRTDTDGKPVAGDAAFGANVETIRKPAIRACIIGRRLAEKIEPLPTEFVDWLLDFVTDEQEDVLWLGALAASRGPDAVPLPRPRSTTRLSDSV